MSFCCTCGGERKMFIIMLAFKIKMKYNGCIDEWRLYKT